MLTICKTAGVPTPAANPTGRTQQGILILVQSSRLTGGCFPQKSQASRMGPDPAKPFSPAKKLSCPSIPKINGTAR